MLCELIFTYLVTLIVYKTTYAITFIDRVDKRDKA